MKNAIYAFIIFSIYLFNSERCFGQDVIAEHKVKGLKKLNSLAITVLPNTPTEIVSIKELFDMIEVNLHHYVPEITIINSTSDSQAWLELSIITTERSGFLELCLYRWVKVLDSNEDIFSKVWWDARLVIGNLSMKYLQDTLESIFTSFAADYFRSNR